MRISLSSDELTGVACVLADEMLARRHEPLLRGALAERERSDWVWASEQAARDVAEGRAEQAIVCCWTGTGASIAANKLAGVRAALCTDAVTAAGARRWNDANVLALSLRLTSPALLGEILDAWFEGARSEDLSDRANVERLAELGQARVSGPSAQLSVKRGRVAVDFYREAFDAREIYRVGGSDEHEELVSQLRVGDGTFWVADESPEHENFSPETLGGGSVRMLLVVEDPAATMARALALGAREVRQVAEEHGWLMGRIEDPFGHHWEIARPLVAWPPTEGAGETS